MSQGAGGIFVSDDMGRSFTRVGGVASTNCATALPCNDMNNDFLAVAYESGPYKTLSAAYQTDFANKPETPESKAALEKIGVVMDRIVDAYARAIAAAGTDPKTEQSRKEWLTAMSTYYKFRHGGTDTGMTEYITTVLQKPLPPKP